MKEADIKQIKYKINTICPKCKHNHYYYNRGTNLIRLKIQQKRSITCGQCHHTFHYTAKNTIIRDENGHVFGGSSHGDKQQEMF